VKKNITYNAAYSEERCERLSPRLGICFNGAHHY